MVPESDNGRRLHATNAGNERESATASGQRVVHVQRRRLKHVSIKIRGMQSSESQGTRSYSTERPDAADVRCRDLMMLRAKVYELENILLAPHLQSPESLQVNHNTTTSPPITTIAVNSNVFSSQAADTYMVPINHSRPDSMSENTPDDRDAHRDDVYGPQIVDDRSHHQAEESTQEPRHKFQVSFVPDTRSQSKSRRSASFDLSTGFDMLEPNNAGEIDSSEDEQVTSEAPGDPLGLLSTSAQYDSPEAMLSAKGGHFVGASGVMSFGKHIQDVAQMNLGPEQGGNLYGTILGKRRSSRAILLATES